MGIDIDHKHQRKGRRTDSNSDDPYLALLIKLYRFLARRTGAAFNETVLKRLYQSRSTRAPVSTSRLALALKDKKADQIAVVVGTVTDDSRLLDLPKMRVAALKFTRRARERILKAGGEVLTFDQLALQRPKGQNTILLRGPKHARSAYKFFGPAPGTPGSAARPRVLKKGLHKKEQARGRRRSRGYKN